MELNHFTFKSSLEGIKREGLLPLLGLTFLTKASNEVYKIPFANYDIKLEVDTDVETYNVYEALDTEEGVDLLNNFMDVSMIGLVANTKDWYYTDEVIPMSDITVIELE